MLELKDMPNMLISVVVVIMLAGALVMGLYSFQNSSSIYETKTRLNQSIVIGNNTYVTYAQAGDDLIGLTEVRYLNGTVLLTSTYTVSGSTVNITKPDGTYYVDYTHKGGSAYNISKTGTVSILNLTSNFSTLGTVLGIILIIGMITAMLYRRNNL